MEDLFAKPGKEKKKYTIKKKCAKNDLTDDNIESEKKNDILYKFVQLVNKGLSREEIIDELGLKTNQFESLVGAYYNGLEEEIESKSPLKLYAEIVSRKNKLFRDLERFKDAMEEGVDKVDGRKGKAWQNGQAYVAAVRAQDCILDSMVSTGQGLGLVKKAAEKVYMVGDKDIRDMDADSLEIEVFKILEETRELIGKRNIKQAKDIGQVIAFPANARTT